MQWLRLYHDTITDPKWRVVANESGQPEANVLAVWMHMLVNASTSAERGTLEGWNDRVVAAGLGIRTEAVVAIFDAMQGLVLDGNRLTGWEKRQFASDDAAEVKRKQRARRRKTPPDGGGKGGHGTDQDIARPNGSVHGQTANVHRQSTDCPDHVQENPLVSVLPSCPPTTLNNEGGGDARAREVAARVAGLTELPAKGRNLATVEAWLTAGYDPERDIYPAVAAVVDAAKDEIGCFKYFTKAIGRYHAERTAPPPSNVSYLPSAAGGRRADPPMSPAARDLMAAYHDPNFTYGVGR